jgi:hypothetical protein
MWTPWSQPPPPRKLSLQEVAVLQRENWSGRRGSNPRPRPWQGYDTGPTDFAQLREISTKLRNLNMIVWSITPRSGASGITFGIPSGRVRPVGSERHEDLQEQLKPPIGGVFLGLNGIIIKSHAGSDAEVFADAINLG